MTSSSPSRRTVLTTAAWSIPAVSIAAAAPAFASSTGTVSLSYTRLSAYDGNVKVRNTRNTAVEVTLTFTPTPDEDVPASLQGVQGLETFTQISTTPHSLRGTIDADSEISAWCWWRQPTGGTGTTTVTATAAGMTVPALTVALG